MYLSDNLKYLRSLKNLTQEKMAVETGISRINIAKWEGGTTPSPKYLDILSDYFNVPVSDLLYLEMNKKDMVEPLPTNARIVADHQSPHFYTNKSGNTFQETIDGKLMLMTRLVTKKGRAGYLTGWGDEEYMDTLPPHPIVVDEAHKGFYLSFEVEGDSMDDDSKRAISDGDIVTGRRISRHLWERSRLHLKSYSCYVIHHKNGILVKCIIDHDIENGTITCHSLNPNKELYPDIILNLSDVSQIFNIVSKTTKSK